MPGHDKSIKDSDTEHRHLAGKQNRDDDAVVRAEVVGDVSLAGCVLDPLSPIVALIWLAGCVGRLSPE